MCTLLVGVLVYGNVHSVPWETTGYALTAGPMEQLGVGAKRQDNDLVFTTTIGTAIDAQNVVNRHFKPMLSRAGLPEIRWHDLRHTCATLLLSRGTHPTFVQKLLGHASVQLTLDRYSH